MITKDGSSSCSRPIGTLRNSSRTGILLITQTHYISLTGCVIKVRIQFANYLTSPCYILVFSSPLPSIVTNLLVLKCSSCISVSTTNCNDLPSWYRMLLYLIHNCSYHQIFFLFAGGKKTYLFKQSQVFEPGKVKYAFQVLLI